MDDINRHFEFVDKEDILKKIVSLEFGRFLKYYADAPEILKPTNERNKRDTEGRGKTGRTDRSRGPRKAEAGFKRLFINLGKADGFYPGEVMQFVNRHVDGRQEIGHIDLLSKFSYIEVPEQDAQKVIRALDGTSYKGRSVRCNDADSRDGGASGRGSRGGRSSRDGGNRGSRDDSRSSGRSERTSRRGRDNDGFGKNDGFAKYEKKSKRRNYDDDSTLGEWQERRLEAVFPAQRQREAERHRARLYRGRLGKKKAKKEIRVDLPPKEAKRVPVFNLRQGPFLSLTELSHENNELHFR